LPHRKNGQSRPTPGQPATVDLHLHSTASDGSYPPAKVIELASARGLTTVALTDHDTIDGLAGARAAVDAHGMNFINGIECDAASTKGTLHILGYFIDPQCERLTVFLSDARARRRERNRAMLDRLSSLGIELAIDEQHTSLDSLGRRHVAQRLVDTGVVNHPTAAFRDYIGEGGKAFVPMPSPSAREVIDVLHHAGGVAVLAHPVTLQIKNALELETTIARFAHYGLDGIEVVHPAQSQAQRQQFVQLAQRFDLVTTGGSDFHALAWKQPRGIGFGESVTEQVVSQLEARRRNREKRQ